MSDRIPIDDVQIEAPYAWPCICDSFLLSREGCKCGAMAAERADKLSSKRVREYAERERLLELRDFLIPPPTPPITILSACPRAGCHHEPHRKRACPAKDCECVDC